MHSYYPYKVILLCLSIPYYRFLGSHINTHVSLKGVGDAFDKHSDKEHKGIKAHFRMDESGMPHFDDVSRHTYVPYCECLAVGKFGEFGKSSVLCQTLISQILAYQRYPYG